MELEEGGALAKLASDPASRKRFLKMMGGAGGASALGLALAACGSASSGGAASSAASSSSGASVSDSSSGQKPVQAAKKGPPSRHGDLGIMNFALTLELLESEFYRKAVGGGLLKGRELDAFRLISGHENDHVTALQQAITQMGGTPVAKPTFRFPLGSRSSIIGFAQSVENLGASAYLGQAPRIRDPKVLAAALSIHTVEARHAAALNRMVGKDITPDGAFAQPRTMQEVLKMAKPYIVS